MAKKECPSCAMQIEENSEVCPVCGYEFPSPVKFRWIAILLLVVFLLLLIWRLI